MRRAPVVKQHDATDCAAACLHSVAAYYRCRVPISRIRQYAGTDARGTNVLGLIEAAKRLGFEAKGIRAAFESLESLPMPAVAHFVLENGCHHFVVMVEMRRGRIRLMDPALGRTLKMREESFRSRWSGVLIILAPSSDFQERDERASNAGRFWRLVRPHKTVMTQALAGAVVYTALGLSTAIYLQKIVDHVLVDGNENLLNLLSLLMVGILAVRGYIGWSKNMFSLRTAQKIDATLILGYYRHLLALPQHFFDTMRVGEIIARVNDAVKIRAFINDVSLELVVNVLVVLFSFVLMFTYDWRIALAVLGAIPAYAAIFQIANRINRKALRQTMERGADLESHLVESLSAVSTIKRFGLHRRSTLETEARFVRLLRPVYSSGRAAIGAGSAAELISGLAIVGVLWGGSRLVLQSDLTPGELMSFYALLGYFTGPAAQLVASNQTVQDALIASDRLFEIMDLERERGDDPALELPAGKELEVAFEKVSFRYGTRPAVLDELSVTFAPRRITAIVGASGSGKSTIVALANGLYPLTGGRIRVGGHDVRHISPESLRRRIAVVPQDVHLFSGDVIENVALGDREPNMLLLLQVCDRLGVTEFVESLPNGFHTQIGENGVSLSGGQRQRLAIARALYREPDVLALDEATSNLDSISEAYVQATLRSLRDESRTVILIAHRLTSAMDADVILVLEHGAIVERGTHDDLLGAAGPYSRLWRAQHAVAAAAPAGVG